MRQILAMARKELDGYFSSLMALIFVGVFLAVTLFTFFWVSDFWARGLADVRPLFRWIPLLMVFLVGALTMRQWSEEQQTGTLEILLTMPVRLAQLVLGKFLAVLTLVAVALALTLFLPITISTLGNLDWGPVFGGYLAAVLMAASYVAIGLFISSRTDNQIVALIVTVLLAGALHLIGQPAITELVSSGTGEFLRSISTSGRFASIERGVIDLHDLLYYISLTAIFLGLNVLSLVMRRWGRGEQARPVRWNTRLTTILSVLNIVALNVVLFPVNIGRFDLTGDNLYTLSEATHEVLDNLHEPLLLRAYLSEENHPLLEPLIPQIRDTLEEYAIAADDNLTVEIVDPIQDPELEAEANQTYGISPAPLMVADRTGQSVLNVYFHILVRYGDQSKVLDFQDLITFDQFGDDFEVRLRNLEYDLTSAIKHVVEGFQSVDSVLASLESPAELTLYTTPGTLPQALAEVPQLIETVAGAIADESGGKLVFETVDVDAEDSPVTRDSLYEQYQIRPFAASFFSPETYLLHMVLEVGDRVQVLYPSGDLSEAGLRTAIESALKRAAPGFLEVVGIWTPPAVTTDPFGQQQATLQQYQTVRQALRENYEVRTVSLADGQVPADVDVLFVLAPRNMSEREQYAIDQFLMRGGSVFLAVSPYRLTQDPMSGSIALEPVEGNLSELLEHYGITVEDGLVLDPQNQPFALPVQRNIGGITITEIQAINYPPFVDVRPDGMERSNPSVTDLPALTVSWASPITIDEERNADRQVTELLRSSPRSWHTSSTTIQPNLDLYELGFRVEEPQQRYTLGVAVQGQFDSYFADKDIPVEMDETDADSAEAEDTAEEEIDPLLATGKLERSPDTARLVVVGSAEFLSDVVFQISNNFNNERTMNNVQFVQNMVDWFNEDTELAAIRSKTSSVRLLKPLTESEQTRWEVTNYALALISLGVLGVVWRMKKRAEQPMPLTEPGEAQVPAQKSAAA